MKQPLFSICIPNYNYARYIGKTIQSVLNQTCQDFEIIVADNASTDNSVEIVRQFNDARIYLVINQYNVGFAPNLDRATESARGEYIILLSSDDLMTPSALGRYTELISKYRNGKKIQGEPDKLMLFSAIAMIDAEGIIFDSRPARPWNAPNSTELKPVDASGTVFWYSGLDVLRHQMKQLDGIGRFAATCVARDIYDKVCGFHTVHTIDPDMFYDYKCLSLDPITAYIEEPLFHYRMHNQNQRSQEQKLGAPRLYIDRYYYTIEFDQNFLSKIGLSQNDIRDAFLKETCGQAALLNALRRKTRRAWQGFLFAAATYPRQYFKLWYPYVLLIVLVSGPIIPWIFQMMKWIKDKFSQSGQSQKEPAT